MPNPTPVVRGFSRPAFVTRVCVSPSAGIPPLFLHLFLLLLNFFPSFSFFIDLLTPVIEWFHRQRPSRPLCRESMTSHGPWHSSHSLRLLLTDFPFSSLKWLTSYPLRLLAVSNHHPPFDGSGFQSYHSEVVFFSPAIGISPFFFLPQNQQIPPF